MKSFNFRNLCRMLILLLLVCSYSYSAGDQINPNAILDKMHKVYADANSYQDTGVVETIMDFVNRKQTMTKTFSIAFKRPNNIKIEWIDTMFGGQKNRSVLWSDGKQTQIFWEQLNQVQKSESLMMGIAAATGVSGGAAHTVPSMLLEDLKMPALSVLTNVKLLREEVFEGVPCFVLVGKHPAGVDYTLWIGKGDYLLRKLEYFVKSNIEMMKAAESELDKINKEHEISMPDTSKMPDFSITNRQIYRDIKLNEIIPNALITFSPPENAKQVDSFQIDQ